MILISDICSRERCPVSFVGQVTSDGHVKLVEGSMENAKNLDTSKDLPFDLNLEAVLGKFSKQSITLYYIYVMNLF